jgi:integrase
MQRDEPKPFFGDRVANAVLESHIDEYKDKRLAEGASKVTISRELQVLKRAFNLGLQRRLIKSKPHIELFPEPPPREGHYEYSDFIKFQYVARPIDAHKNFDGVVVADIVLFGYFSGWRLNECLGLHKDWIRLQERVAVLPPSKHKNKRAKILPLEGKLWSLVEQRYANASPEGLLFHRNGRRIKSIRRLCLSICEIAQIDSAHFFHNLRRSFRTNIGLAGVGEDVGIKLMGHTTKSVYDNYNQVITERLRDAEKHLHNSMRDNNRHPVATNTRTCALGIYNNLNDLTFRL